MASFNLEFWSSDFQQIKTACKLCEHLGYDGFFYGETLNPLDMDCWTILPSLSQLTSKIRLGPVLTYFFPGYRSPALLAKMAATLDCLSNGRLEFRVGAGAPRKWAESWWSPYGITYPTTKNRVAMLREGLTLLKALWTKEAVTFDGKYFKLRNVRCMPKPRQKPHPRITIAAMGRSTMDIAANYANVWEASYLSPEAYSDKLSSFINRHNRAKTRNMQKSLEVDVVVGKTTQEAKKELRKFLVARKITMKHPLLKSVVYGTPEDCVRKLKRYVELGIDSFTLAFSDPASAKILRLFAEHVIAKL